MNGSRDRKRAIQPETEGPGSAAELLRQRNIRLILASASPRRRELLEQAGISPVIRPSRREEKARAKRPAELVKALSRGKAEDIAAQVEAVVDRTAGRLLILGADTIVVRDGEVLGKPRDPADAVRMLQSLSGRTHHVYTGVTMILMEIPGFAAASSSMDLTSASHLGLHQQVSFFEKTSVTFYPLTDAEIRAYVDSGDPLDKAGAYGIQGSFGQYVKGIHGDYTNVVGLPLGRTVQEMKALVTAALRTSV